LFEGRSDQKSLIVEQATIAPCHEGKILPPGHLLTAKHITHYQISPLSRDWQQTDSSLLHGAINFLTFPQIETQPKAILITQPPWRQHPSFQRDCPLRE
jgi:hypothetical protein